MRRTLSLRATLLLVIAGLLVATVGTIGSVSFIQNTKSITELAQSLGDEIARGASAKVRAVLSPARSVLLESRDMARRGLLPVNDPEALGLRLAERLRHEPDIMWLSFGYADGGFVGTWRRGDGKIILNRSWLKPEGGGWMMEEVINPDGTREPVRSEASDYDTRKRPYFAVGAAAEGLAWTEPYYWPNQGLGISAVMPLREGGELRGVFTADFFLDDLSVFLNRIKYHQSGRVFITTRKGQVIAGPRGEPLVNVRDVDVVVAAAMEQGLSLAAVPLDQPQARAVRFGGEDYGMVSQALELPGGMQWVIVMYVPAREVFGFIDRNLRWTMGIAAVSLLGALVLATIVSARIARPLGAVARDLVQVGRFELAGDDLPESRIEEVRVVGDAVQRMKASLRSFSRYVPADLVRQTLAEGREATLHAEPRQLTLFFSDLEGFSVLCEVLPPAKLVDLMGEYFAIMTRELSAEGGTVDKFIGDGVLAFFNAPRPLPHHAAAACRASVAILEGIRPFCTARDDGRPPTRTRIGLHSGEVLVGNLGTPSRFHYTVVGDGVNLTYGLQLLSKVYGTWVIASQETRDAAGPGFVWRRLDRVAVKGRAGSGFVYELLGLEGAVDRALVRAAGVYEQAMEDYLGRRFESAARGFNAAWEMRMDDRAARVLLARANRFIEQPPDGEWGGVYVFATTPSEA